MEGFRQVLGAVGEKNFGNASGGDKEQLCHQAQMFPTEMHIQFQVANEYSGKGGGWGLLCSTGRHSGLHRAGPSTPGSLGHG